VAAYETECRLAGITTFNPMVDVCGECGGDGTECLGCDGVPFSNLVVDQCGECDGDNACYCDGITYCPCLLPAFCVYLYSITRHLQVATCPVISDKYS
jgi:hypothetical protein